MGAHVHRDSPNDELIQGTVQAKRIRGGLWSSKNSRFALVSVRPSLSSSNSLWISGLCSHLHKGSQHVKEPIAETVQNVVHSRWSVVVTGFAVICPPLTLPAFTPTLSVLFLPLYLSSWLALPLLVFSLSTARMNVRFLPPSSVHKATLKLVPQRL